MSGHDPEKVGAAELDARTAALPFVDEHATMIAADADEVWAALLEVVERSFSAPGASGFARLLGCRETASTGARPFAPGSSCPGFRVAVAAEPSELALVGHHRFSNYALIFRLDPLGAGQTRLRAETRAEFPALKGRVYRGLVIGTHGHVLVTRSILRGVARSAGEKGGSPAGAAAGTR